MPFRKGDKKPPNSGRTKGTPNKATEKAVAIMEKAGFEPVRRAIALYNATDNENVKAQMIALLMKRKYPELKAIEISGDPDKPLYVKDVDARRARIAELEAKMKDVTPIMVIDAE